MRMCKFRLCLIHWIGLQLVAGASNIMSRSARNGPWSMCGCPDCDSSVWNADAEGVSCGDRITYLKEASNFAASKSCRSVAALEYPSQCGPCNPDTCVQNLMDDLGQVAPSNDAPTLTIANFRCGCELCETYGWQVDADGHSCGNRIDYLLTVPDLYPTELEACRQVAVVEYATQCGLCNPDRCDGAPSPNPDTYSAATNPPQTNQPPTEVYCFPPSAQRTRFFNAWGQYTVEVKEGEMCGPGDNLFNKNGVAMDEINSELTLQLGKQSDGRWYAGEVRILLPVTAYYDYGQYSFSVKSVNVMDTITGTIVSQTLPPSIILGLFTWDDTKNFALKEDYNLEVDIELSRWDIYDNGDVQFLVQPPGRPQMHRFYSGEPATSSLPVYDQAPHVYSFHWKPAEITWSSTSGGSQSFTYGTREALDAGQPDYTQCMPGRVEVRINLWNLNGSFVAPSEMEDTHVVQVVIDNFDYQPSGTTALPEGGVCSKDCHCGNLQCVQNRCTPSDSLNAIIAAASTAEESSVSAWRDNRWVVLGVLVSLAILTGIINFWYYRRQTYGTADYSDSEENEEELEEQVADSKSLSPGGINAAKAPIITSEDGVTQFASLPFPLQTLTVEDKFELFPSNRDRYSIIEMPDGVEVAESIAPSHSSISVPVEQLEENKPSLFYFVDWLKQLHCRKTYKTAITSEPEEQVPEANEDIAGNKSLTQAVELQDKYEWFPSSQDRYSINSIGEGVEVA